EGHEVPPAVRLGGDDLEVDPRRSPAGDRDEVGSGVEPFDAIRDEIDRDLSAQTVRTADPPDLEQRHGWVVRQSTMSTVASVPSLAAAARTTDRSACATRPRRPMIRPMSDPATCRSSRSPPR